jgi:hypothetical protein
MVEDRISNIEARVKDSSGMPEATRAELLGLLATLRAELGGVNKEHLERAEGSAAPHQPGESLDESVGGLTGTVTALEAHHPRLAELANRVAVTLSNIGI